MRKKKEFLGSHTFVAWYGSMPPNNNFKDASLFDRELAEMQKMLAKENVSHNTWMITLMYSNHF